jgi:hypothetical protein
MRSRSDAEKIIIVIMQMNGETKPKDKPPHGAHVFSGDEKRKKK